MNQPWSNLSNAHHIDWVVESLKDNHEMWNAAMWVAVRGETRAAATAPAWGVARRELARASAYDAAYDAARSEACSAARETAWYAVRGAARDEACSAARDAAWDAAWDAARCAILALVAYDDCDQYLAMSYEELTIWAALSEHPAAFLLLPMVYVREKLHEPALV